MKNERKILKIRTVFFAAAVGTTMLGTVEFLIATTTTRTTATTTTAFASYELKIRLDDIIEQVFFLTFIIRQIRMDFSKQKFSVSMFIGL